MSVIRTYHDGLVDRWNATGRRTAGANDDNDNDSAAMLVAIHPRPKVIAGAR